MGVELDRPFYDGLNSTATDLWRKFLKYYEDAFEAYAYNVRVGEGIAAPAYLTDEEKRIWKMLTQKRIDVVAQRFQESWVIEIDERPGLRTVGQLTGYLHLGQKYLNMRQTVRAALVCARLGHDMAEIFRAQNVLVFLFPPAGDPSFPPSFLPTGVTTPPAA